MVSLNFFAYHTTLCLFAINLQVLQLSLLKMFLMERVRSGWTMPSVLELRPDSLTVLLMLLVIQTVDTMRMQV